MNNKVQEGHVIGIDDGTQEVSAVMVSLDGEVLAGGSSDPVPLLKGPNGEREQHHGDWKQALIQALARARLGGNNLGKCLGVCPSAQMHGEGNRQENGEFVDPVRLWCDSRNKDEAAELCDLLGYYIAQRLLIARWLWTIRNRPQLARQCVGLTTPAGILATFFDQKAWGLGLGDACGAFPVNPETLQYDTVMAAKFDKLVAGNGVRPLLQLLAPPVMVGDIVGHVDAWGAELFGLEVGIPIYSPEGDQPTTEAGTYVCDPGVVSVSGGTSICLNLITDKTFHGMHPGVEPFMTADGMRFLMCQGKVPISDQLMSNK